MSAWAEDIETILQSPTWSKAKTFELQTVLLEVGYDVGDADGIIGPRTIHALQAWYKSTQSTDAQLDPSVSMRVKMLTATAPSQRTATGGPSVTFAGYAGTLRVTRGHVRQIGEAWGRSFDVVHVQLRGRPAKTKILESVSVHLNNGEKFDAEFFSRTRDISVEYNGPGAKKVESERNGTLVLSGDTYTKLSYAKGDRATFSAMESDRVYRDGRYRFSENQDFARFSLFVLIPSEAQQSLDTILLNFEEASP
tara:strand:+ start:638 stop:1393 length:756 start_codon:yes stop_codon:yes gene_type:complete